MKKMPILERASLLLITERQDDVLRALIEFGMWARPMDVGGRDGSHHHRTLMQLVDLQLVDTKKIHSVHCCFGTRHVMVRVRGRWVIRRTKKPITLCRCKGSRRFRAAE